MAKSAQGNATKIQNNSTLDPKLMAKGKSMKASFGKYSNNLSKLDKKKSDQESEQSFDLETKLKNDKEIAEKLEKEFDQILEQLKLGVYEDHHKERVI